MAGNLSNPAELTSAQLSVRNQIISYGQQKGYSQEMIATALLSANAESDFNPTQNDGKPATGLFQYQPPAWSNSLGDFIRNHPDNGLITGAQPKAAYLADTTLQIAVFFSDLEKYSLEWTSGAYLGQATTASNINILSQKGYKVDTFPEFVYLRHNGTIDQTANIVFGDAARSVKGSDGKTSIIWGQQWVSID